VEYVFFIQLNINNIYVNIFHCPDLLLVRYVRHDYTNFKVSTPSKSETRFWYLIARHYAFN